MDQKKKMRWLFHLKIEVIAIRFWKEYLKSYLSIQEEDQCRRTEKQERVKVLMRKTNRLNDPRLLSSD